MRPLWIVVLVTAGCAGVESSQDADGTLDVYAFDHPGAGGMSADSPGAVGWLFRVHNPGSAASVQGCTLGLDFVKQGPTIDGWQAGGGRATTPDGRAGWCGEPFQLAYNTSVAYIVQASAVDGDASMRFYLDDALAYNRPMQVHATDGVRVVPGMHVETHTVGVWENGTSFYTNIPHLLADARFPGGGNIDVPNATLDAAPLPIYVYESTRHEQPPASRDTCHFTTIAGYNALLKSQDDGSTAVRYLLPEEAYTVTGNEGGFLYGDALIFLNTIVTVADATDATDTAPEPFGACYDVQNTFDYFGVDAPAPLTR